MRRHLWLAGSLLLVAACGGRGKPNSRPGPDGRPAEAATPGAVDSIWRLAEQAFRRGKYGETIKQLERVNLEFAPGDARIPRSHFMLGESYLARADQLGAAREFRRVSDEYPSDTLAASALLRVGDAYSDLWRRPELDPTYGQTALATYNEVVSRYPDDEASRRARAKATALEEQFAFKAYKAGMFYLRLKAYDSAIIYFKDIAASYPKASITPLALIRLISAYRAIDYQEDIRETCGYMMRFHGGVAGIKEACTAPVKPTKVAKQKQQETPEATPAAIDSAAAKKPAAAADSQAVKPAPAPPVADTTKTTPETRP